MIRTMALRWRFSLAEITVDMPKIQTQGRKKKKKTSNRWPDAEEKREERAKHWQCGSEVQNQENKPWQN